MPCYKPMIVRRTVDFDGYVVPCGRCIGCRLERSRQWAVRCVLESKSHENNVFLTLTYSDEELVIGFVRPTLYPRHLTLFFKRLRKRFGDGIRYFACGEYGDKSHRPHYHACVFGLDFDDKILCSTSGGFNLYHSNILDDIWKHGYCTIGEFSFETAAYTARYIMNKHLGDDAQYYNTHAIEPEFVRMSRRPGLGSAWYDEFYNDVFPSDIMIVRDGIKQKPPRYFFEKYRLENPMDGVILSMRRRMNADAQFDDNVGDRLKIKERIKYAQIKSLERKL